MGHRWGFLREGTEAKDCEHRRAGNALSCMVLWAGVQSIVLAHWQTRHTRLKSFQHLIN